MTGNRFGSAYELGTSNYLSQVNQNELGMASGLYQQSQNTINSDMMSILGDAWKWKNNQGSILPLLLTSLAPTAGKLPSSSGGGGGSIGGINIPQTPSTPPTFPGTPTTTQTPTTTAGNATIQQPPGTGSASILSDTGNSPYNQQGMQAALNSYLTAMQNGDTSTAQQAWQAFLQNSGNSQYNSYTNTNQVPTDNSNTFGYSQGSVDPNAGMGNTMGLQPLTPPAGTVDMSGTSGYGNGYSDYYGYYANSSGTDANIPYDYTGFMDMSGSYGG
jgi:hypothetical protein